MANRLDLQALLEDLLGKRNVYFQPPESVKMNYPAIVYALEDIESTFADDGLYLFHKQYTVTVIDKNPDSEFVDKVAALPTCRFSRHYKSDNLNHYVFSIYF
nr:MAG TPA: tail completion protein [Caudoviricetes sp.]